LTVFLGDRPQETALQIAKVGDLACPDVTVEN